MTQDRDSESLHPILDDMALNAITQPIESLKQELTDAGINVQSDITRFKNIALSAVSQYQGHLLKRLPDVVPEDDESVSRLLEHLFTMPQVTGTNLMMGFRNLEELSVSDKRELTISLLDLIRDQQ